MAAKKKPTTKTAAKPETQSAPAPPRDNIDLLDDVQLMMTVELGRARQTFGLVKEFGEQSLVELDKTVGEPVDIMLNGALFARGEVVTVSENFGVRVTELVAQPGG